MSQRTAGDDRPLTGLPISASLEEISRYRLGLVVAGAKFHLQDTKVDYDAVDTIIASSDEYELWYAPSIKVQLKCSASRNVTRLLANGTISFSLDRASYMKLSNPKHHTPTLLVVLLLPEAADPAEYVQQTDEGLFSPGSLLFSDPSRWRPLPPGQKSGTVSLRPTDVLSPARLQDLMKTFGDGGDW
ncbi:DUF4365 domain-containing protein [Streptomyces sp. NPDC054804]